MAGSEQIISGISSITFVDRADADRPSVFTYMLGGTEYPCIEVRRCKTCMARGYRKRIESLFLHGIPYAAIHREMSNHMDISEKAIARHLQNHLPAEILAEWKAREEHAQKLGIPDDGHRLTDLHLLDEVARRAYVEMVEGRQVPTIAQGIQVINLKAAFGIQDDRMTQEVYEEAFRVFMAKTRDIMPPAMFREFSESIYRDPVLAQLDAKLKKAHATNTSARESLPAEV